MVSLAELDLLQAFNCEIQVPKSKHSFLNEQDLIFHTVTQIKKEYLKKSYKFQFQLHITVQNLILTPTTKLAIIAHFQNILVILELFRFRTLYKESTTPILC